MHGPQIWPAAILQAYTTPMRTYGYRWHVAKQMFEAVRFMHQHSVAHPDLPNIVDGSHLSIIDFDRSVRVKGAEHIFHGIVGTTAYLAPEVAAGQGLYSAICADSWSCVPCVCRPEIATRCSR